MSLCKRKITKDPLATNSEVEKCKAVWDLKATEYFIQGCLDQVSKGERNGTTLTKKDWQAVTSYFFDLTGKKYDKSQFKNSMKNTVDASNEWWEHKIAENPKYDKFRNKGLPFYNELTILFKDVTATGEFAWAPSSGILPNGLGGNEGDEEDVYRPSPIDLDTEEGSGDSEDASVGATNEFTDINLNSSQGTVNQNSEGKRKRVGQGEVLAELQTLDEVANDPVFHTNCCQLMMFKPARETFIGLRGLEEKRMHWLRHAAYNPIPFMKM
ncbi:hypothetical protein V6N12_067073 [Hibiscus sabdariffa]|uniref:Myb/SANT-like domain-containing protein n=1 Tax=Hibiscus sabdariffa TaxID=183260 RepID=A0ABR1ZZB6_9ROSI